ncbi:helix-turn-helix transcriptional regulator [Spongisporangium articulatum]|uniref:Helix-turn-helix transcriptional regulator n=1 Tax=Spongisporangium articulatum TaxID=3362603 RepID=A0ABW8ASD3_9ACTN
MDRPGLADFLRTRREAMQPADVGLPPGVRRRAPGLRREEVAALAEMSTDYYARLEQERGPQPSEQIVASLARALRLRLDEREHLFRLAGHQAPARVNRSDHVAPALLRVLDRLHDTPAQVVSDLGETLVQNPMAVALLGPQTGGEGIERSQTYRWFTDPASRAIYPERDHDHQAHVQVARLRAASTRAGGDPRARELVSRLLAASSEFRALWELHEVGELTDARKTIVHPELGEIEVDCQVLLTENRAQSLLVFTATPGSESYRRLELLAVVGRQFS